MNNPKRPAAVLAVLTAWLVAALAGCGGSAGDPGGGGGARGSGGAGSGGVKGSGGSNGRGGSNGSGGGTAPAGIPEAMACNQAASAFCTKIFGCQDATLMLIRALLKTEADCEATVVQNCGAAGFQCAAGATYHGDQAQTCTSDFASQSCQTIGAAVAAAAGSGASTANVVAHLGASIPSCSQICTGGNDGGTG